MRQPTLFLTVGLPAFGDDCGPAPGDRARRISPHERRMDEGARRRTEPAVSLRRHRRTTHRDRAARSPTGHHVVIDFGLGSRDERSALRQAAADRGASVVTHYFEVSPAEQRRRLDQLQTGEPHTTWPISDEELAGWAGIVQIPTPGELDGSEPIDDPPAGFASWDEWRVYRWTPRIF